MSLTQELSLKIYQENPNESELPEINKNELLFTDNIYVFNELLLNIFLLNLISTPYH